MLTFYYSVSCCSGDTGAANACLQDEELPAAALRAWQQGDEQNMKHEERK